MAFHATLLKTVGGIAGAGGGLNAGAEFGSDTLNTRTGSQGSGFKMNNISSGGGVPAWALIVAAVLVVIVIRRGIK